MIEKLQNKLIIYMVNKRPKQDTAAKMKNNHPKIGFSVEYL